MNCDCCGVASKPGEAFVPHSESGEPWCPRCLANEAKIRGRDRDDSARARRSVEVAAASRRVLVTGTPTIDGHRIAQYLGIESVEIVIGTGVFSELSSFVADSFGARSSAFERKLAEAKQHAMDTLRYIAAERGANAVVSVDLDYTEFSGNRIALIVNGTLVVAKPIKDQQSIT